jgi:hypothetical protein
MQMLKKLVGRTALVAVAAVSVTVGFGGTGQSASCPSDQFLCKARSSWFGSTVKCCPNTHNCCPGYTCLDVRGRVIRRISESCLLPPTPCPTC